MLRYLADAYKALRQTVPEEARTEELTDLIEWLGELVRQVDSSLIDEWERLRNPAAEAAGPAPADDRPPAVTGNVRAFRVLVRNALFRRVELAALRRYDELGELDAEAGWDADAWADALEPYFDEHDEIGTGPDARGPGLLIIDQQPDQWAVRQIFDDPAGDHDWGFSARSTWPPPTRRARPCCGSPKSASSAAGLANSASSPAGWPPRRPKLAGARR